MNSKIEEIVNRVKSEIPSIVKNNDDKIIKKIVIKTVEQLHKEILESEEDKVRIPKLGVFRKREIDKDGEKKVRINFLPAKVSEKESVG